MDLQSKSNGSNLQYKGLNSCKKIAEKIKTAIGVNPNDFSNHDNWRHALQKGLKSNANEILEKEKPAEILASAKLFLLNPEKLQSWLEARV